MLTSASCTPDALTVMNRKGLFMHIKCYLLSHSQTEATEEREMEGERERRGGGGSENDGPPEDRGPPLEQCGQEHGGPGGG